MRKINSAELPDNHSLYPLIKGSDRNRHCKSMMAIQKTLEHCHHIRAEFESELADLKILSKNEGYLAGLTMFFNELIQLLVSYEEKQNVRFSAYKDFIKSQIESAFFDPEMVDIIISYAQSYFKDDKKIILVFPEKFKAIVDGYNTYDGLIYTDGFNFAAKNDADIIMLPYAALCNKVFSEADLHIKHMSENLYSVLPEHIDNIISTLLRFKNEMLENYKGGECEQP
ncbi:hypothetical protein QCA75_004777 [Salmonella enterica]|nr:hypothetical protein [Salmonella enterica]